MDITHFDTLTFPYRKHVNVKLVVTQMLSMMSLLL
jgi:hypothetical protein